MDRFSKRILIILTSTVVLLTIILAFDVLLSHNIIFVVKEVNVIEFVVDVFIAFTTFYVAYATYRVTKRMDKRDEEDKERQCSSVISLSKSKKPALVYLRSETSDCKEGSTLCFSLTNSGEAMLQKIILTSDDYKEFNFVSHLAIPKGDNKAVYLTLPDCFRDENKIRITFISCYGKETYGTFVLKEIDKCKFASCKNCKGRTYTLKYYHYNAFDKKGK